MQCEKPILIRKPGTAIFQNEQISVPCGKCFACQLNKARDWAVRIMQEERCHEASVFVTLTYDEEHLPIASGTQGTLVKKDLQDFFKRLRKNYGKKIRFFACGEYGENYSRPHYHAIIFGISKMDEAVIVRSWSFGFVYVGSVSFGSASYVARYTTKLLTKDKEKFYIVNNLQKEFALMSRRPGIGVPFLEKYGDFGKVHKFFWQDDFKVPLPRLYRTKLFQTEEEQQEIKDFIAKKAKEVQERFLKNATPYEALCKKESSARQAIVNKKARFNLKKGKLS